MRESGARCSNVRERKWGKEKGACGDGRVPDREKWTGNFILKLEVFMLYLVLEDIFLPVISTWSEK